jgi:hypothetical protein
MKKIVDLYLENYIKSLFAGAFLGHNYEQLKVDIPLVTKTESMTLFIMNH